MTTKLVGPRVEERSGPTAGEWQAARTAAPTNTRDDRAAARLNWASQER